MDAFDGTAGDDTFTAAAGTIQSGDVLSDTSESDNDTLNLVLSGSTAGTPIEFTATKIENINVTVDNLSGANAVLDASNINGLTTITMNAGKAVDGVVFVQDAGANNVTAGAGVKDLRVEDATVSTIDAGSATKVTVDDTAATDNKIKVIANGDLDLTATTTSATDALTIEATKASVVNLNAASALTGTVTVTGENDVTLDSGDVLDGLTVKDSTTDATVLVDIDTAAATVDASAWTVDGIIISADLGTSTVTTKTAANVEITKSQTDLTIDAASALADTTVNITTGVDSTSITLTNSDLTNNLKTTNLAITADAEIGTIAVADKVVVTGSSELTIGDIDADELDMSAYTGKTTVESSAAASIELGSGVNKLTLADAAYLIAGGASADTIDAQAVASAASTVVASLGAGDDVVKIDKLGDDFTVVGGAGSDTVWVANGGDTTGGSLILTDVEKIEVENQTAGADTTGIDLNGSDLDGQTLSVLTADSIDDVTVTVTADEATTDLSGISQTNIDTFSIVGNDNTAETIIGTQGADEIDAGAAAAADKVNTITGGAGKDTFIFAADDSVEGSVSSITDYTAGEDKLDININTVAADDTTDLNAAGVNAGQAGVVNAIIADGVMTLSGLAADVAKFDTLAEWVDAAEAALAGADATLAFEFGGDTYVISNDFTTGTPGTNATDTLIELTGVTGITAVDAAAAANTIQIA